MNNYKTSEDGYILSGNGVGLLPISEIKNLPENSKVRIICYNSLNSRFGRGSFSDVKKNIELDIHGATLSKDAFHGSSLCPFTYLSEIRNNLNIVENLTTVRSEFEKRFNFFVKMQNSFEEYSEGNEENPTGITWSYVHYDMKNALKELRISFEEFMIDKQTETSKEKIINKFGNYSSLFIMKYAEDEINEIIRHLNKDDDVMKNYTKNDAFYVDKKGNHYFIIFLEKGDFLTNAPSDLFGMESQSENSKNLKTITDLLRRDEIESTDIIKTRQKIYNVLHSSINLLTEYPNFEGNNGYTSLSVMNTYNNLFTAMQNMNVHPFSFIDKDKLNEFLTAYNLPEEKPVYDQQYFTD